jgi:hypothetical protein
MTNQVEVTILPAEEVSVEITNAQTEEVSVEVNDVNEPTVVEVNAISEPVIIEINAPAFQRPTASIRVDASTAGTIYVGSASYGALESDDVWTIIRSLFTSDGVRTSREKVINTAWASRSLISYS